MGSFLETGDEAKRSYRRGAVFALAFLVPSLAVRWIFASDGAGAITLFALLILVPVVLVVRDRRQTKAEEQIREH